MTLTATTSTRYLARREVCTCGHQFRANESWCPLCQEAATPALARFDMSTLQLPAQRQVQSRTAAQAQPTRTTLTTAMIALVASGAVILLTLLVAMLSAIS